MEYRRFNMKEDNLIRLVIDDTKYQTTVTKKYLSRKKYTPIDPDIIITTIPGSIIDIFVKAGQKIKKGDSLFILEAMKMKNEVKSARNGIIKEIFVSKFSQVAKGQILLRFEKE